MCMIWNTNKTHLPHYLFNLYGNLKPHEVCQGVISFAHANSIEIQCMLTQQGWHVLENSEQFWGNGRAVLQCHQPYEGGIYENRKRQEKNKLEVGMKYGKEKRRWTEDSGVEQKKGVKSTLKETGSQKRWKHCHHKKEWGRCKRKIGKVKGLLRGGLRIQN